MTFGSLLRDFLSNTTSVTMAAMAALVVVEVALRRTGFARPDTVNLDLEEPAHHRYRHQPGAQGPDRSA